MWIHRWGQVNIEAETAQVVNRTEIVFMLELLPIWIGEG
jgi:hypothetical protein|tara:strand:- start:461 stop:577 length:117 start_codon:yes stop_codon:yes gene_type:complete